VVARSDCCCRRCEHLRSKVAERGSCVEDSSISLGNWVTGGLQRESRLDVLGLEVLDNDAEQWNGAGQ
jgi:hypothetical protein